MQATRVISFDPGGTSGYCELLVVPTSVEIVRIGEFPDWRGIDMLSLDVGKHHVVYESYMGGAKSQSISFQVIGVIRYLCSKNPQCTLFRQTPEQRIFAEKRYPELLTGYKKHHLDALMHALTYAYHQLNIRGNDFTYIRKAPSFQH